MLFLSTTLTGLQLGLCYAIIALGMYIAYSILDFPDLSTDGTFPLGGVIGTILIYNLNFPPFLALFGGFIAGAVAGAITGVLHVKFKITKLLAGIIVMTALLSITLALTTVLTGTGFSTTNFSYIANKINGMFNNGFNVLNDGLTILILVAIVAAAKIILDLFFKTKFGFMLKATGDNETLVTSLGKDVGFYKIIGLAIANGLVGFGGALYAQLTLNYDNTCGSGKVVLALASVIIGTAIFSKAKFVKPTTQVIVGAIIYALCLNYFTLVDTNGLYLKLMNAVCFAVILIVNNYLKKSKVKKSTHAPVQTETGGGENNG